MVKLCCIWDVLKVQLVAREADIQMTNWSVVDSIIDYENNTFHLSSGVNADTFYVRIRHTDTS